MAIKALRRLAFIGAYRRIAAPAAACDTLCCDGPGSPGRVPGNFREMWRRGGPWPRIANSRLTCFVSTREPGGFGATAARSSSRRVLPPCCSCWPSEPKNSSPSRICSSACGAAWQSATTRSPPVFRSCALCSATTPGARTTSRPGIGAAIASWCPPRSTNKVVLPRRHCRSRHPNRRDWSGGSQSSASLRMPSIRRDPAGVRSFSSAASRASARVHLRTRFWSSYRRARRSRSRTANVSTITALVNPICL